MNDSTSQSAWSLEKFQAMMSRCPFNRWLGLQARSISIQGVEILLPWRDELMGTPEAQAMHGGILASVIDTAGSYAVAALLGRGVPTVDMRIDYHRIAKPGDYTVKGRVVHFGRTLSAAEAQVHDAGGVLVASGRGAYFCASGSTPAPVTSTATTVSRSES